MTDLLRPATLSARAAEEITHIMKTKNIPDNYFLRLGAKGGGGCGGSQLIIGFDQQKQTDLRYKQGNLDVLVDKKHVLFLIGKEVDFYEGSDARGFLFVDRDKPKD
jgi:iron-sulfur cluster assembly protein